MKFSAQKVYRCIIGKFMIQAGTSESLIYVKDVYGGNVIDGTAFFYGRSKEGQIITYDRHRTLWIRKQILKKKEIPIATYISVEPASISDICFLQDIINKDCIRQRREGIERRERYNRYREKYPPFHFLDNIIKKENV
jgi:hypothetical protein